MGHVEEYVMPLLKIMFYPLQGDCMYVGLKLWELQWVVTKGHYLDALRQHMINVRLQRPLGLLGLGFRICFRGMDIWFRI